MANGYLGILGDSIFKGVQLDGSGGRYIVNDRLGFGEIASKAGLTMQNFSKFGCTVTKAWGYVQRMFAKVNSDMVFMDFGGNDSDFNWDEISRSPLEVHRPNTELADFEATYERMVDYLMARRSLPVVSTLVPIQGDMYLDHLCTVRGADRDGIMKWLGDDISRIESFQRMYSDAVRGVASRCCIPLIDLRAAFMGHSDCRSLMCADGIHPNSSGQKVIHDCFEAFMDDYIAL